MAWSIRLATIGLFLAGSGAASAQSWQIGRTDSGAPLAVVETDKGTPFYRFECGPDGVTASFLGASELVDPGTGAKVGDAPGSTMLPGAARMGLMTDKAQPDFVPAVAAPHPGGGWDLTIRIAKDDPVFRSLPRATIVALASTGMVVAVLVKDADRKPLADFVRQCRGR